MLLFKTQVTNPLKSGCMGVSSAKEMILLVMGQKNQIPAGNEAEINDAFQSGRGVISDPVIEMDCLAFDWNISDQVASDVVVTGGKFFPFLIESVPRCHVTIESHAKGFLAIEIVQKAHQFAGAIKHAKGDKPCVGNGKDNLLVFGGERCENDEDLKKKNKKPLHK